MQFGSENLRQMSVCRKVTLDTLNAAPSPHRTNSKVHGHEPLPAQSHGPAAQSVLLPAPGQRDRARRPPGAGSALRPWALRHRKSRAWPPGGPIRPRPASPLSHGHASLAGLGLALLGRAGRGELCS